MSDYIERIKEAIVNRKKNDLEPAVRAALDDGLAVDNIVNDALIAAMDIVGRQFSNSEIFVPEMLVSARIMKQGLEIVKPLLVGQASKSTGKVVLCTVHGDLHDIGKNIVAMMLEGAGFQVMDLGVDLSKEAIAEQVVAEKPDIIGMSALLSTTMPEMKEVLSELEARGLRGSVKVVIGGAPVSQEYADQIGADGYGDDAAQAVELCRALLAKNSPPPA